MFDVRKSGVCVDVKILRSAEIWCGEGKNNIKIFPVLRSTNPKICCVKVRKSICSLYEGLQIQIFAVLTSANIFFSLYQGLQIQKKIVVPTSANPVCEDIKILKSAEIQCGVRT